MDRRASGPGRAGPGGKKPFFAYLAGDAPERNQRMRDGWTGFLRHASNGLSHTYTTDDHAGVAVWHPPGYTGAGFIDSLRLLPSATRMAHRWGSSTRPRWGSAPPRRPCAGPGRA